MLGKSDADQIHGEAPRWAGAASPDMPFEMLAHHAVDFWLCGRTSSFFPSIDAVNPSLTAGARRSTTVTATGDRRSARAANNPAKPAEDHHPAGVTWSCTGDQPPVAKPGKSVIPPST
ncbi:hypothetical protein OH786_36095 (plasmid) [Streptomyces atratus]|uniref:Uncharacterized protein n=1 Tax=Streptomyces atratus TaxID=1893 RepID=A0A1K1ZXM2_STRAR|nr:hypothetical protein [Streptomyces atratus]SFX79026.1 hypothetical protein SAMN02787144_1006165 [Streptomyces atratus]